MNEQNETYGIKLTAIISEFKKRMNEALNYTKDFGRKAEEETTIMPKFVDTGYQKQIDYVKSQMEDIQDLLKRASEGEELGKDVMKLEADYETLSYKLQDLIEKQDEFNNELEETSSEANKTHINLSSMFDRSIAKIKRFTYYLLGARSVFSLFRKYQSIYFQYNEQMQYQTELSQNAIALSLAPVFKFLGDAIAYASIGFAKFIELLTGVNVLSKVTTKGIRDHNKALKEQRTLLSGIDEITNLDRTSGGTGLADQYKALADFQDKVKEVEEWFEKNPWIGQFANGLKSVVDFISEHWDIFKYIIGGVALSSLFGLPLKGGILGLTISVLIIGVAAAMIEIEKLKASINKIAPANEEKYHLEILNQIDKLKNKLKGLKKGSKEYNDVVIEINQKWQAVTGSIQRGDEDVLKHKDEVKKLAKELDGVTNKAELYGRTVNTSIEIAEKRREWDERGFLQRWSDWFTRADETHDAYLDNLQSDYKKAYEHIVEMAETELKRLNRLELDKKIIDIGVKYNIKKSDVQTLINKVRGISVNLFGMPESTFNTIANKVLKKFGYKKGLDYVPYDDYPALLHKGEAVVPAKYNPTIHSAGNEYTNSLLETLVMKMDDLSKRPNVFEVDGKQFAQTTYPLYESERKKQNYIEGVVR